MRVWLDDVRPAPEGWTWCKTPSEVIDLLKAGEVEEISLDHDVNVFEGDREITGMAVLIWIERKVALEGFTPPRIEIHSANPPAHERMLRAVAAIQRLHQGNARP